MAAITLAQAQAQLAVWLQASAALATAQSYEIEISGTRRKVTRANLGEINQQIGYWSRMVNSKTRGRLRMAIPTDL